MNGSPQLPQYTFDPVTKRYTLITPAQEQQTRSGLGGLYDATSGGGMGVTAPTSGFNSMSPGYAEMGVGLQNIGQFSSNNPVMAAFSPVTSGVTAIAGAIGNAMMGSEVSPVAAPVAPTETAIAPVGIGGDGGGGGDVGGGGDSGAASGDSGGVTSGEGLAMGGRVMKYEQGGLASAAKQIQSKGRGDDSVLVHMTPREVRSLQAIAMQHGGSLTVNPETGLVEANFLKSILPMVAGAALAATGIGAPMAAMLVGGGATLMTGSLEKGLMAGLGAFGGAGLGSALSAAGAASTAGQTITPQLANVAAVTPQGTLTPLAAATPPAAGIGGLGSGINIVNPAAPGFGVPASMAAPVSQVAGAVTPAAAPVTFGNMGAGIKALGTEGGRAAFMQSVGGPMGLATKVGGPLAAGMFSAEKETEKGIKPETYIRPYSFDYQKASDLDPSFRYRTGERGESTAEQRYFTPTFTPLGTFKAGTEPGGSFYGTPTQEQLALYSRPKDQNILGLAAGGVAGLGKGGLRDGAFIVPADVVSHLGNGSNDAGQKILRGLGARPIKGKGDGMSDSIPTTIEGRQPARVADGEAYIPPEVVKKIGAKRLYSMMEKIRQARTGTRKQAPEVNPREFMPA